MNATSIVGNHLIANLLITIKISHIRQRQDSDFCLRKPRAHGAQCRQSHDGVPYPVRRANQEFHAAAPTRISSAWSMTERKSASGESSRSMTETYTGSEEN